MAFDNFIGWKIAKDFKETSGVMQKENSRVSFSAELLRIGS